MKFGRVYVAGISKVSALTRTTEVIEHREGGNPNTVPKATGQSKYWAIILERFVTHDPDFEAWAQKVWTRGNGLGQEVSLEDFKRDLTIELLNEAGQVAVGYTTVMLAEPVDHVIGIDPD